MVDIEVKKKWGCWIDCLYSAQIYRKSGNLYRGRDLKPRVLISKEVV